MNRYVRYGLIALGALFALGVVGAIVSPNHPTNQVADRSVPVTTLTPAPSATPTDSPTPPVLPTLAPTPEPTEDADLAAWLDWNLHVLDSSQTFIKDAGDIADDAQDGQWNQMARHALRLSGHASDELAWLEDHPAAPCFAGQARKWKAAMAAYEQGASLLFTGASAMDIPTLYEAIPLIKKGNRALDQFNAASSGSDC